MGLSRLTGTPDAASLDAMRDPSATALKARAASDPKSVIKTAAKQFEALFMQQLMKSMREASMSSGMLDNGGTQLGTELLDAQYADKLTGLPGGLSDMIARQLERQMSGTSAAKVSAAIALPPAAAAGAAGAAAASSGSAANPTPSQADFIGKHASAAQEAQAQTGIPAAFMIAQAAHESGWGKREIRNADGSSAHNLFGIKAGANWKGATTTITTTEVIDGEARKVQAKFRAYGSDAESFRDFAQLMKDNPRYASVMNSTTADGFAKGLQRAGYATDPAYADKLTRVINTTLRVQRAASKAPENLA
jgi:flagellar protein FlgJ